MLLMGDPLELMEYLMWVLFAMLVLALIATVLV